MRRLLMCVSRAMIVMILATSIVIPSQGYAAPGQFVSQWAQIRATSITKVPMPLGNWTDIARMRGAGSAPPNIEMIRGEKWITLARDEVGMLGLSSGQAADILKQFPGRMIQVFARYSPENAQLQITLVRVEQRPDGFVYVSRGDWTPHHGEYYRAFRHFLTPTERLDTGVTGYNPFQSFRGGNTDPVFYNISFTAALVAVGHAMRLNQVATGWLAVSTSRPDVQTHESGNIFRRTVTTTVDGKVSPVWFFVSAPELQPYGGFSGQICASPSHVVPKPGGAAGETTCDDAAHVVQAGIVANQWTGGNMSSPEDTVYHWETTKSSWTVLTFVTITFLLFWAGGAAYGALAGAGGTAAGAAAATAGSTSGLIAGLSPLQFGALAGGLYATGSTGFGTNAGLTAAQGSYAGSTGAGVLATPVPTSEQQAGLQQGIKARQIDQPITGGLTGTRQLYMGNCPENYTIGQCRSGGLDPGAVNRPDAYVETNTTLQMRQQYHACVAQGYTGAALERCAAPKPVGAFSQP